MTPVRGTTYVTAMLYNGSVAIVSAKALWRWIGVCGAERRTIVREGRLKRKWLRRVGGEGFPQRVDLRLHLRHWPGGGALLKNAHVSSEEVLSVQVELWIG